MTPEQVHDEVLEFRAQIHKEFGDFKTEVQKEFGNFKTEMQKEFGNFKTDIVKTLWITQLSTIGIILIGMGLLIRFLH